jgi:hypothetical protein
MLCALAAAGIMMLMTSVGWADDKSAAQKVSEAPKDVAEKAAATDKKPEGWTSKLRLGGTFSFSHSSKVVGSQDGTNTQVGLVLDSARNLTRGPSTWENGLGIQLTESRTPALDVFIKSMDNLDFQSTYYFWLKHPGWIGPYGRFRLTTQILTGSEVRAADIDIRKLFLDGSDSVFTLKAEDKLKLTRSFEPLVLAQNAGLFANPPGTDLVSLRAKLGLGLQEIVVGDKAFSVQDDGATPELDVRQLDDVVQGGGVLETNLAGKIAQNITWKTDANIFVEAFTDSKVKANAFNLDVRGGLSVKLAKWASLDYVLMVKRVPRITNDWQVQHGVILTAGFDLL